MKEKLISSKRVVAYIIRKFGLVDEGWVGDCMESMGHALGTLNIGLTTTKTKVDKTVANYKAFPPCEAEYIMSVYLDGCKLIKIDPNRVDPEVLVNGYTPVSSYWWNGPYVQFTRETGTVTFHYETFSCDDDGYVMIPNSDILVEALAWHFMSEYLASGNSHPVFNFEYADAKWELFQSRAYNDVNFPGIDDAARFSRMFTNLAPNLDLHKTDYVTYLYDANENDDITEFTGTTL